MNMSVKLMHDTRASRLDDLMAIVPLTSTNLRRILMFPTDQKHI